ncbi:MAG TPA: preprotein translocase subunit SecG [Bryobacteraceae bacterium]|nr:preprotein translocase subunit SecG [Bryobacteraceae bacterium]
MIVLVTAIHVVLCLFLIVVVLLQSGKAADLAGAFGGMGSQTVFGPRGSATMLSKATTVAAAAFMLTSLTLSIMATRAGKAAPGLLENASRPVPAQTQKSPVPQPQSAPGQTPATVPLQVHTSVDGHDTGTQKVQAPVVNPQTGKPVSAPAQQKK